jgi:hypothetical protein
MELPEPNRNSGFPILPGELRLRTGCGVLIGLLVGLRFALRWFRPSPTWPQLVGSLLVMALLCGVGARWGGDRFWRR